MISLKRLLVTATLSVLAITGITMTAAKAAPAVEFSYHWSNGSNGIVVQEMGHVASRWALSAVIHDWNAGQVLNVHLGNCWDFPNQHCVQVSSYNAKDTGPAGYTVIATDSETPTMIYLNTGYWNWSSVDSHAVTCHEFGHAVGFTHDERSGCTSEVNRETPSRWQLNKAARAYLATS